MKLFFILCFLFTASQLKAQYTVAKEPLPCLLLETFLKELVFSNNKHLNMCSCAAFDAFPWIMSIDTMVIVFTNKSSRLSYCKIDKIEQFYHCEYKDDVININTDTLLNFNVVYKKQDTYHMNQHRESILFNSAHIVITSIEE